LNKNRIIELIAVALNLLFTYFYLKGNEVCFLFGIVSPVLFVYLTWQKKIYADTLLQIFYIGIAIYGLVNWGGEWKKIHWSTTTQLYYIAAGICISLLSGYLLRKNTDAALPYLDSFITTFAIIATWQMMNFVHENWLYFIAINATSVFLYVKRKLYIGALMFVIYLLMSFDGYFELNIF
jgi:nicotinamide mononucleotide transporter